MRTIILATLLLAPLVAAADPPECKHGADQQLALDLDGVDTVVFHVGPHDLDLTASSGARPTIQARACASSAELLTGMKLEQRREGATLHVETERPDLSGFSLFGSRYARFDLRGTVPDDIPVQVKVGSGDATVTGAASLEGSVGSGDMVVRQVAGAVTAVVGSGDLDVHDVGSLDVGSVGSGDLEARRVRGNVRIGSIGSGDAGLEGVGGDVEVGSIGSGDLQVERVEGSLRVRLVGSGDVEHRGVNGSVSLPD